MSYGEAFHIVLGGPCYTSFVLNVTRKSQVKCQSSFATQKLRNNTNDSEKEDEEYCQLVHDVMALYKRMLRYENYTLRNGSVRRFIRYVKKAMAHGEEKAGDETNPAKRAKIMRYMTEQERLIDKATKILQNPQAMHVWDL
uniref:Uncharacterized protein n=1 Tax=Lygus hesperus TaxID=30085 RepID=A0A146LHT5_LYGHE